MTATDRDSIALCAYFIWEDEGRPHGRHESHWFAAEAALAPAAGPVPAQKAAVKVAATRKAAAPKKAAQPKAAAPKAAAPEATAPKAPAETVVAAAALAAPRAARSAAKGGRRAH